MIVNKYAYWIQHTMHHYGWIQIDCFYIKNIKDEHLDTFSFTSSYFLKVAINLWYFVLFSCLGRRQCMFEKILHRFKGLAASSHINNNSSSTFLMSLFIQYIQEPKEFIIHACVALVFWKVFIQHCNHNSNDENNLNLSTYFHFNQNTY